MLKRAGAERIFVDFPPGDFHLIEPALITADIVLPKPNTFARQAPKLTSALSADQCHLEGAGFRFLNERGQPFNPKSIRAMVPPRASGPTAIALLGRSAATA
jgi:hypothetical protein